MIKFEQIRPANSVDKHDSILYRPPLKIHAIAMAANLKSNHARTKCLKQHLGIGRIVAEICDGSRSMWIATPSSYRTCTDYLLPVSRRTAKDSGHYRRD
jgi:hypothetical protein